MTRAGRYSIPRGRIDWQIGGLADHPRLRKGLLARDPAVAPTEQTRRCDKARQFRALHEAPNAFVIANVWDGGSARMIAALGFAALATSSGGLGHGHPAS